MPEFTMQEAAPSGPPAIQASPSGGEASLAYSMDTDAMMEAATPTPPTGGKGHASQRSREELPPLAQPAGGAEESYYGENATAEYDMFPEEALPASLADYQGAADATATVHEMHRKLLHLLSHHELFADAMEWQSKVDRGLDPSKPEGAEGNGIKSFENEFDEQSRNTAAEERKDEVATEDGTAGAAEEEEEEEASKFKDQEKLIPPLPLQIFASDAEVVLPQALTASQLFGMERVTGIELEAAAGIIGLSQLFLRWLALMPEGDHMNVIDPPGLTVMRISGGRYRVTGAHRVVWRWMNKFSPASTFAVPGDFKPSESMEESASKPDTDFDFGDLVTMTIIDVFETDADGRLLSYCPTFDNRAVHKTQEVTERIRKGASHLKESIAVAARSPAGKNVNKVSLLVLGVRFLSDSSHECFPFLSVGGRGHWQNDPQRGPGRGKHRQNEDRGGDAQASASRRRRRRGYGRRGHRGGRGRGGRCRGGCGRTGEGGAIGRHAGRGCVEGRGIFQRRQHRSRDKRGVK